MRHRIYTVLNIYNSVRRLNIDFDRCKPNRSILTVLRQRASIAMMLPRCQESARGVRREGSRLFSALNAFLRLCFCLHAWASYRFHMIDNWTSALLRERYDAPIQLNHGCLF